MADRQQPPPPVAPAPPPPVAPAPPLLPASGNPNPTSILPPPPAPTHSAAAPAHPLPHVSGNPDPDPTPISSGLEEAITSGLSSRFGNEDQQQCRLVIGQIKEALSVRQKMFPELDALFHQGHVPQNAEKQLQLMSSILDRQKLEALLQILQSDPGMPPPEDVHQGGQSSAQPQQQRLRAQRQGLPGRQQNVGPLPATLGATSSSPPLDAPHSPEPNVDNEIEPDDPPPAVDPQPGVNLEPVVGGNEQQSGSGLGNQQPVVVDPTQQAPPPVINPIPPHPIPPPVVHPIPPHPIPPPVVHPIPPPVINPIPPHPIPPPVVHPIPPPVINPEPVVGGENLQQDGNVVGNQQQDGNVVGNQQAAGNANAYDGFGIHGLTRQGFNKFSMRFKAINDLTLKEYICILRNRESFEVLGAPMPEPKEGVFVYHAPPELDQGRVVSDGGADGQHWDRQRSYSRQVLQERVRYTKYQCQADPHWTKKVYRTSSVAGWVVVHYRFSGAAPIINSMVTHVNILRKSFEELRAHDNSICAQIVEELQPT